MMQLLHLLRIKHWIKNILIFFTAFFGGVLLEMSNLKILAFVFLYFSFTASLIYIINDLKDVEKDKLHPEKKNRPLASGAVSKTQAYVLIGFLLIALGIASIYVPLQVFYVTLAYFILNILYTFWLKHIAIIELFIISLGFVFRIIIGGLAVSVVASKWIIMLTFFMALYVIIAKRRGELLHSTANKTRNVLAYYSEQYLSSAMILVLGVSIVTYIMYTIDEDVISRFDTDEIYITTIFVVLAMLRHLQQTFVHNNTESPVKYILKDHLILIIILMWLSSFYFLIYF
ncbi:UbiA prenyltransferase family protein [Kordia jejudonensis]|uniref:UbiA prenyltransferase family protein n=1 Tax=Kordia jejudonensis TaxID=1348245 RepID=UPI0006296EAF|nr:UbiA prenyltransferase family protein [Kordia jejudonensis]